ncbi:hypothetical protein M0804_005599 [Polistes exclamans]|nr:hypothetical protein M0804_005599 [Polistes exclamans]
MGPTSRENGRTKSSFSEFDWKISSLPNALEWNDVNMRWNVSEYGGVKDLRIPPHRLWKPDVLMYNSSSNSSITTTNTDSRNISSTGGIYNARMKETYQVDWFVGWIVGQHQEHTRIQPLVRCCRGLETAQPNPVVGGSVREEVGEVDVEVELEENRVA